MLLPFIPRFVMPALDLPDCPRIPAPGTRLSLPMAQALFDSLLHYSAQIMFQRAQFREAWKAHYTQHGRPVPPLDLPPPRKA